MSTWELHDYLSPGLAHVEPDDAFPGVGPRDTAGHPWPHLRRDVPHHWYADDRLPHIGVLNRDEAAILHTLARSLPTGSRVLEIGGWVGWSTAHLALAGVEVDAVEPAWADEELRAQVETSLDACGVGDRVRLVAGASPDAVRELGERGIRWAMAFVDGDHDGAAPTRDALACLPYLEPDCLVVLHDLAAPPVAEALRALEAEGFSVAAYQTAQLMGVAWRGRAAPVLHAPDPEVAWQMPRHMAGLAVFGVDAPDGRRGADRALRDLPPAPEPERPTVCVVTNELLGPFRNGGIGTSMTGLAETLAAAGFPVTVLYTGNLWTPGVDLAGWQTHYLEHGIVLEALDFSELTRLRGPLRDAAFVTPHLVARYLAERAFDVVHVNDCCGDGALALAAKALGLAHRDTLFVLALHSPSRWVLDLNATLPTDLLLTAYDYAERLSVRCADVVWSPSQYMLDWARDAGFALPGQTFVQPYSLTGPRVAARRGRAARPREIVFFGRLEERKGLRLFCNALQLAAGALAERAVTVTFLGKIGECGGRAADAYVDERSAGWPFEHRILSGLDRDAALDYLAGGERLAVMASPADNSPCTIYEALGRGVPFLAARAGGIPELVGGDDAVHVLFEPTSEGLAAALREVLDEGAWVAAPAVDPAEVDRALVTLHERWRSLLPERPRAPEPQRWAAAVIDHASGDDLQATLDSLEPCPWIRDVLVLDRTGCATTDRRRVDLTRADPADAARAILMADGEDVLLVRSGARLVAEGLNRMLGALPGATADGLLPDGAVLEPDEPDLAVPSLGGSAAFGLYAGVTYTGAALIERGAITRALRRHEPVGDAPFLGIPDFCVADGDLWPFPEVVARLPAVPVSPGAVAPIRIAAYAGAAVNERYYMLGMGYGAFAGAPSAARRRELALRLVDAGLGPAVRVASWTLVRARASRDRMARWPVRTRLRRGR